MNNDYLRVNSKTEDENIAVGEFKSELQETPKVKEQKITVMTLLSFSKNTNPDIDREKLPKFKGLLSIFFVSIFTTFLLTFIAFLTSDVVVLIFTSSIAALVIPLFLLIFFYQFNTQKKTVSFLEIVLGSVVGISLYLISTLAKIYVNEFIYFDWVKEIVDLIFVDCLIFIFAISFVKIAKKDNLYSAMMLAICVYSGYIFAINLDNLISSLFISIQITSNGITTPAGAIIKSEESFKHVIDAFLSTVVSDAFFNSIIVSCYAIINGGLIGISVSPLKDDKYKEWSFAVIFMITIVLHLGAVFPTTIRFFEIILKGLSTIFSITLAISVLNYFLSRMHFSED